VDARKGRLPVSFVSNLLSANHVARFGAEWSQVVAWIALALYFGGMMWLLYIALEPLVRRAWPEKLVSWTRLLAGHFGDPMVARNVLLGTAFYCIFTALEVVALQSHAPLFLGNSLGPLDGLNHSLAGTMDSAINAVRVGLLALLFLLLLRRLGGKGWIATAGLLVVATVIQYLSYGSKQVLYLAIALAICICFVVLLTRLGLLATIVWVFIANFFTSAFPDSTSLTSWYSGCTWWVIGIAMAFAAYGLYYSTAGRPFGDRDLMHACGRDERNPQRLRPGLGPAGRTSCCVVSTRFQGRGPACPPEDGRSRHGPQSYGTKHARLPKRTHLFQSSS
jgi:hypothetical protein